MMIILLTAVCVSIKDDVNSVCGLRLCPGIVCIFCLVSLYIWVVFWAQCLYYFYYFLKMLFIYLKSGKEGEKEISLPSADWLMNYTHHPGLGWTRVSHLGGRIRSPRAITAVPGRLAGSWIRSREAETQTGTLDVECGHPSDSAGPLWPAPTSFFK